MSRLLFFHHVSIIGSHTVHTAQSRIECVSTRLLQMHVYSVDGAFFHAGYLSRHLKCHQQCSIVQIGQS